MVVTFENESLPPLELMLDTGYGGNRPWLASENAARKRGFQQLSRYAGKGAWTGWLPKGESARGFAAGPILIGHRGVRVLDELFRGRRRPHLVSYVADGLVGLRSFSDEWVTELDFDRRVIALHERRGFTYAGRGGEIPLSYDRHGRPVIEARCEAPPCGTSAIELLVDTGFVGDVLLFRESAAPAPHERAAPVIHFGRQRDCRAYRGRLSLGSFELEDVLFAVCARGGRPRTAGLLGVGVLSRFRVIFDTERDRMILEPTKNLQRRTEWDMLGIRWRPRIPPLPRRVSSVRAGSAAAKANLLVKDVVVSINGRDTSELAEWELWEIARGAWGRTLTFRIRRDDKEREVTVKLKPMI
jgi:hypothetical protein